MWCSGFYCRTIVVTEPVCIIKLDLGNGEVWEWVSFDLAVLSIAKDCAFTESFEMSRAVPILATSSLKLGCLPSIWRIWEEKEAQDPLEHLAVDEPFQCSEAHTAPAEVEGSDVLQVCQCLFCSLMASFSRSPNYFHVLNMTHTHMTYCDCRFQCGPGNSSHLRHSCHWSSRRTW